MKFRPLHDRVVIKRIEGEEKTKGGIIIPGSTRDEDKYQGKEKEATYSPPLDAKVLKAKYPHLLKDPVHLWRAENGVELVHQEPDVKELNRIMENWRLMSSDQKAVSESKSRELFGVGNEEHIQVLIEFADVRINGRVGSTGKGCAGGCGEGAGGCGAGDVEVAGGVEGGICWQ